MIKKPMLAGTLTNYNNIIYPVLATPKLDGIRCLTINGPISRTFKNIPNKHVYETMLSLPNNLDGELIIPNKSFNEIQSNIMSEEGNPFFEYHVFDIYSTKSYKERVVDLQNISLPDYCKKILPLPINSEQLLKQYLKKQLELGYEGIMIRKPNGPYKFGRSTEKEGYLLKIKDFYDTEAIIIGFEELTSNQNEATKDNFGRTKRSSCKANLIPMNTLGTLLVKDINTEVEFRIGTGFDDLTRLEIWNNQDQYINKTITYTYQKHGTKNKPRLPVFKGLRRDL